VKIDEELCRVVLHGALHLCGYKDKKKREITIMREKEDYYLRFLKTK
jgi:rRNA maturation RNase YbeY